MRPCKERLSHLNMLAEGQLGPNETRELEEHLVGCEFCSLKLEEYSGIRAILEKGLDDALTVPKIVDTVLDSPPEPVRKTGRIRFVLKWAGISFATVVALILMTIGGYLYSRGFIGPKPVAGKLTHLSAKGAEWRKNERRVRGQTTVLTESGERRALRLNSGIIVVLNEQTDLEIRSENSLILRKGKIYIDTTSQKGVILRIRTDQATAHVTGTKLGVSAEEEKTSVVVEEGKVSVESGWGDQVVVFGNIYRVIESVKPESPEPVDVGEVLFWVKEREHLTGMIIDYFEESDPAFDEDNEALLNELLYGIGQSRKAISSGDLTIDMSKTTHGRGHVLTEGEQKEYAEKVVTGHMAQMASEDAPDEAILQKMIYDAKESAALGSEASTEDEEQNWIFDGTDKVKVDIVSDESRHSHGDMVVNGNLRYRRHMGVVERSAETFMIQNHPAFFGRSPHETTMLKNPRLLGTEELDGAITHKLEADLDIYNDLTDEPLESVIRMWIDPSRGYIVLKTLIHTDSAFKRYSFGFSREAIAESFDEISPGIFYPRSYSVSTFVGDMFLGEKALRKIDETVFTLRDGKFNVSVPLDAFDIPTDLPIGEVDKAGRRVIGQAEKRAKESETEEYLRAIYDELEQIRRYDDPTAPGSRKMVFQLPYNADDFSGAVNTGQGGLIFAPATHHREPVGTRVWRVDPKIAPNVPFLEGDIIYTLNGKPWIFRTLVDLFTGLESCIPVVNAGKPIEGGIRRDGELMYFIIWFD